MFFRNSAHEHQTRTSVLRPYTEELGVRGLAHGGGGGGA